MWRVKIPLICIGTTVALLMSCEGPPPTPKRQKIDIEGLPRCFAVLERLQVHAYRNQDWCKNIWYQRGKFSHQTDPADTCNLFREPPQPFDAKALEDFEWVTTAVAKTDVKLTYISDIVFDRQGRLTQAKFHLAAGRYTYVFSPGYKELPEDMPREREHRRIDESWYFIWEDWN